MTVGSYLNHFWFQLVVALALAGKGWATTNVVFAVLPAAPLWPYVLWGAAAIVVASTLRPFHHLLKAFTGGMLAGLAVLRITSYAVALVHGLPDAAVALAWYLISLWAVTGAVGLAWDRLTEQAALAATVEDGRTGG
jgi:hypothetical protein